MSGTPQETPTKSVGPDRAIKRERERRARARRAAKLESMRLKTDALERAVVVARTLGDDDQVWSDFLDEKTSRIRSFVIRSLQLTHEAATLRLEQVQLARLVQEHQVWERAVRGLISDRPVHDWDALGQCWRRLSREHFRAWTREQCEKEIEAAINEINGFQLGATNKQTTGLSIDGWREVRRLDPAKRILQFEFYKTFRGYDVMDYVNTIWDAFTDARSNQDIVFGRRVRVHHEVLQQLGPNIVIIRVSERYTHMTGDLHGVSLVFRMRTEGGFMQCVRSIWCPELMKAIQGPCDMVALSNFIWYQWDRLEDGAPGYTIRNGGTIGGVEVSYASRWMAEVFASILRGEHKATGRSFGIAIE